MRLFWRLLRLFLPYWGWLLLGVVVSLVTVLANVALMATSGWFIAAMALAGASDGAINYFGPAALIRALAIVRTVGRYVERLITHEATFRLLAGLKVWLYRCVEPASPTILARYHSGDLANRLRADIDRLETAYLKIVLPFLVALFCSGLFVSWLSWYDLRLAVVEATMLALCGWALPIALGWRAQALGRGNVGALTDLSERAVTLLQGMPELLLFGTALRRHVAGFERSAETLIARQRKIGRLAGAGQASLLLGANLGLWGMVVLAIPMVRAQTMAPADLVMISLFALASFEAVTPLPGAVRSLGGLLLSAERIFSLADCCLGSKAADGPKLSPESVNADFCMEKVFFAYAPGDDPVLAGLDLDLGQARRLAVVGPPGSGKSTMIMLLTGLLAPDAGVVSLNGVPLANYDQEALRQLVAVAPQDPSLFTGTVRDNLTLARRDADDDALWRVLKVAHLQDMVKALPGGLDCWLGEAGLTLSGGEARRLSIARALLKKARLLILDEPGEGLDPPMERALLADVAAALDGRSLLLMTHRAAGLALMDGVVRLG